MKTPLLLATAWMLSAGAFACADTRPPMAFPPATAIPVEPARKSSTLGEDQSFRKAPPTAGPEIAFHAPKIEDARLPNGIRILVVERHDLPIVAVSIHVDRGADQAAPGVGGFAGAMLLQGTKNRSALALSDELLAIGASYSAWTDYDMTILQAQCLTENLPELLSIVGDIVQHPAFDKAEMERERSRRLTALEQRKDNPSLLLSDTVASTLYPAGHPYHTPLLGTPEAVKRITQTDLVRFYNANFYPERVTIAVAGDITKDRATREIARVFGAWSGKGGRGTTPAAIAKHPEVPPPPDVKDARVVIVDHPGATQSRLVMALPGVPRKTKDYDALLVMNTLFGGQFSSRLNLNLREKHGYTYGVRSWFDMRLGPGPFTAGGAIQVESTEPAVREILAEMDRLRTELVTPEELEDAKTNLIRQLPARFETASTSAASIGALVVYGLPLDEYATRAARVQKITREDVKRMAETYLRPDRMRLVVVGDAAVIEAPLKKLDLGPMTVEKIAAPAKSPKPTQR